MDTLRGDHVFFLGGGALRLAVPPGKYDVALLHGDGRAASGPMIVKADGASLVGAGRRPGER